MKARLGFSVAANLEADILLVDEVFGVGDATFGNGPKRKFSKWCENQTELSSLLHTVSLF